MPTFSFRKPGENTATYALNPRLSRRALFQRAGALGLSASATAALLAACGASSNTAQTITGTDTITTISGDNIFFPLLETYNKTYPHLKINPLTSSWGNGGQDMKEKELVMMSGGDYPDIAQVVWLKEFALDDLLVDLTDEIKTWDAYPHLTQGQLGRMTYNGRIYGLTLGNNTIIQYYNKDILERVGMTGPLTTLDQVQELAQKIVSNHLTTADGKPIYAVTFDGGNWATDYWLWAGGGEQMNDNFTQTLFDTPASINAFTFMQNFVKTGAAPKPDGTSLQLWLNGQVALYPSGFWDAVATSQATSLHWDAAVMPKGSTGLNTVSIGGVEYCVFKKSAHQAEAISLVKTAASTPWQSNTNKATAAYFCDLSAYDNPTKQAFWSQQGPGVLNTYLATRDQLKSSRYNFLEAPYIFPDASTIYNDALQEILVKLADPASTMQAAATQINQGIQAAQP
jgi:ABC-type glycerol-3-phosphate transport system substrate-binding protein